MPRTRRYPSKKTSNRTRKIKTTAIISDHRITCPARSHKDHPGGRPTFYRPEFNEMARNYCLLGARDVDLAEFLEVVVETIDVWKVEHPLFLQAIKDGRDKANADIAHSAYKRAKGYNTIEEEYKSFPVQELVVGVGGNKTLENTGEEEMRLVRRTHKSVPADPKCIDMFLSFRTKHTKKSHMKWQTSTKMEVTGPEGTPLIPNQSANDERAKITRQAMLKELGKEKK